MTSQAFNKAMGAVIRQERMARGWTMDKIGKQLGCTYQNVQKIEKGIQGCSAFRMVRLADIFGISVATLYKRAAVELNHCRREAA